jgi:hypothetical protein
MRVLNSKVEYLTTMLDGNTMFSIVLVFAFVVQKSQGLTLDKAVLDISEKDFVAS